MNDELEEALNNPHVPESTVIAVRSITAYVDELKTVAAAAVKHWREVMENDFDGVTGYDTEYITNKLAKAIGLE